MEILKPIVTVLIQVTLGIILISTVRGGSQEHEKDSRREYTCSPLIDCQNGSPADFVPDPDDCHNYFICITNTDGDLEPSDTSIPCADGEYFNQEYESCTEEDPEFGCDNACINRECSAECSSYSGEVIAIPEVCDRYYTCDEDGTLTKKTCPTSAPYFDGSGCSPNEYSCCELCLPYCTAKGVETRDPMDCTKYYICMKEGITPTEDYHFTCPDGYYFEPAIGDCEPSGLVQCKSVCS